MYPNSIGVVIDLGARIVGRVVDRLRVVRGLLALLVVGRDGVFLVLLKRNSRRFVWFLDLAQTLVKPLAKLGLPVLLMLLALLVLRLLYSLNPARVGRDGAKPAEVGH